MSADLSKAERKRLKEQYTRDEGARLEEQVALSRPEIASLLAYVDERVAATGCDHTLRYTDAWAREHERDAEEIAASVAVLGAYCDCEVFNLDDLLT